MADDIFFFSASGDAPADFARRLALAVTTAQARVAAIDAGVCPDCQQPITLERRGPAIYALPCGHRLYQGQLPPPPHVLPLDGSSQPGENGTAPKG